MNVPQDELDWIVRGCHRAYEASTLSATLARWDDPAVAREACQAKEAIWSAYRALLATSAKDVDGCGVAAEVPLR